MRLDLIGRILLWWWTRPVLPRSPEQLQDSEIRGLPRYPEAGVATFGGRNGSLSVFAPRPVADPSVHCGSEFHLGGADRSPSKRLGVYLPRDLNQAARASLKW